MFLHDDPYNSSVQKTEYIYSQVKIHCREQAIGICQILG
jgi:hypothetical protein